jgi:glucosamine-6-phosphate deaminase
MPRAISIDGVYIHISQHEHECADAAAERISQLIKHRPHARITWTTGQTFIPVYAQLAEKIKQSEIDCSQNECFQLDEYYPCSSNEPYSFVKFLKDHVVRPLFLSESQCHFFNGEASDPEAEAKRFESLLHDIDLSIQGIGPGGHIGFNESGSLFDSRTRVVDLAPETIARDHQDRGLATPTQALTQGIANILQANQIILVAFGEKKAEVVRQMLKEPVSESCPASALRAVAHKVQVFLDEEAASKL